MTDVSDYKGREREAHRESSVGILAVTAVPILLVGAALLVHIALMKFFGA